MRRLRSQPEMVIALIVLAFAASCAKRPVSFQKNPTVISAPAPARGVPGPEPVSPTGPQGPTSAPPSPSEVAQAPLAPVTPLEGARRPSPSEFAAVSAMRDVYFDFDRHNISPDAATTLMANAAWMKSHPGTSMLIEGHCDERGTVEYNLALGQRRAQSTRDFLMAQGIPGSRLALISYGKERPVCSESTEACWARNRRAHFLAKPS